MGMASEKERVQFARKHPEEIEAEINVSAILIRESALVCSLET